MALGDILKYDKSLSFFERTYISIFGVPINGLRIRARRVLPLITKKYNCIMDAGCGPGVFTFEIAKMNPLCKIYGYDIDDESIETNKKIAENLKLNNCFFKNQDILELNEPEKFDLILSVDNLEHIEDDLKALSSFNFALKKGGTLMLHVPGLYRRWKFFGWAENFYVNGHFRSGYTLEEINEKLLKTGFEIDIAYYTYGWLETITNNISYWITKAQKKNKFLYAFIFPFLNWISYFGRNSRPKKGAGILVIAIKK